jgi:GAF domain-containing protein
MSCPLVAANGHRMGTLCFADEVPRSFAAADVRLLANLAELAARLLEERMQLGARLVGGQEPSLTAALHR